MPKKKFNSYKFEDLKNDYTALTKEITHLQNQIIEKDDQRNEIIKKIRDIQNESNSKLDYKLLLDVNIKNEVNEEVQIKSAGNDILDSNINSNIIKSNSLLSIDKIIIKKQNHNDDDFNLSDDNDETSD
jgi:site-specific DNA-adenine methylase